MQRCEREVFGIDAYDLADLAVEIFAAAFEDQAIKDTNDSVRTGYHNWN